MLRRNFLMSGITGVFCLFGFGKKTRSQSPSGVRVHWLQRFEKGTKVPIEWDDIKTGDTLLFTHYREGTNKYVRLRIIKNIRCVPGTERTMTWFGKDELIWDLIDNKYYTGWEYFENNFLSLKKSDGDLISRYDPNGQKT